MGVSSGPDNSDREDLPLYKRYFAQRAVDPDELPGIMRRHIYTGALGNVWGFLISGVFFVYFGNAVGMTPFDWGVMGGLSSIFLTAELVGARLTRRVGRRKWLWFWFALASRSVRFAGVLVSWWLFTRNLPGAVAVLTVLSPGQPTSVTNGLVVYLNFDNNLNGQLGTTVNGALWTGGATNGPRYKPGMIGAAASFANTGSSGQPSLSSNRHCRVTPWPVVPSSNLPSWPMTKRCRTISSASARKKSSPSAATSLPSRTGRRVTTTPARPRLSPTVATVSR
jgi:hypothetical protein